MSKNINRRRFLTNTAFGTGAVALSSFTWPFTNITNLNAPTHKKLIATTDYTDNIGKNHRGSRYGAPFHATKNIMPTTGVL